CVYSEFEPEQEDRVLARTVGGPGIGVGWYGAPVGGGRDVTGPRPFRASRGLFHGRRFSIPRVARCRRTDSGPGRALAGFALHAARRPPHGRLPGASWDRPGACVRRADGPVRRAGG